MQLRWSIKGEKEVLKRLEKLRSAEVNKVVRGVLNQASNETAQIARTLVPVDTGALRSTIRPIPTMLIRNRVKTGVAAGGPIGSGAPVKPGVSKKTGRVAPDVVTYDRYVHEDLTAHHDVGEAKFLEKAMMVVRPYVKGWIQDAIRTLLRKR